MLTTQEIEPQTFPLAPLAEWFRAFYSGPPWDERWRCPVCSPPGDFVGRVGRYGEADLKVCPVCGTELETYWSDARTEEYFLDAVSRLDFAGNIHRVDGELAAWTWGYAAKEVAELAQLPATYFYVDVIGVLPAIRSAENVQAVFTAGHDMVRRHGFDFTVTRTRSDAEYVKDAMRTHGYKPLFPSMDGEREFWIHSL